ncbi:MAG: radical SAM protein [Candidatus Omnitrophota bacterium]
MFSVGIIIPSWHYWNSPCRIQPLYELYFATIIDSRLSAENVDTGIIDLRGIRLDQQIYHIPERDLYLYWIAKTADYSGIQTIVTQLKLIYPKAKHVAGGTHIDVFPEESSQDFDAVVVGPGEESFINIINDCRKGLLNKIYKTDYKNVQYNDYPYIRRHYLPESAIVNNLLFERYGENIRSTCVLFSRGCCFRCKFCAYNIPSFIQMRSPKSIKEEIKYLKEEYNVQAINLKDEICIPVSREVAIPFLESIRDSQIMWRGQTAIVGITEEKIALARKSGCVELAVGVESVSQQVLDIIDKKISIQDVKNFIKLCKKYSIKVKMCLIFGLPGEPRDIVEMTRSFIEENKPDYVSLSGLSPMPGSEIYNNYRYYGIKCIETDWDKYAHLLYRFSDYEEVGLPYEYEESNRWGKTFFREEIIENIRQLQRYCRERNMAY